MKIKDTIIGIFLIATILTLIILPPTWIIDSLLMISMGLSILILLNALYSREVLEMSLFPTIVLVITMFRIALSVSTTRLIILEGDAGAVIRTFGAFVAGGNLVVGCIMFVIIVMVNFLVITKGSERVAEVTARFTLDAMPGKQMAIDADLNTGLIGEEEAKVRRKKIQEESTFFGAMDGASKFVKNDAIAGIILTLINIIAGVLLGTTGVATGTPLEFGDALELYAILTIGDGLVSQLPALLISVAMSIVITKANNRQRIGL